ncbi:MAG: glutathione synthase [Candidatus Puniceispirillaceae bacterium]
MISPTLSFAIQMDPIAGIDVISDSTFALGLEAQSRGHTLWYYTPENLSLNEGIVTAHGQSLHLFDKIGAHFKAGETETRSLDEFDVVLMRQDPPFNMAYITTTHILERLPARTMVVNNPAEVRNAPEKLLVTHYPDLLPATLITRNINAIHAFRAKHNDIILKPLFGNGGAGVFRIQPFDQNLNSLLEMFFSSNYEPIMVQEYLPEIRQGDKRVILINGYAVGAVNRIPVEGEVRSNFHVGGTPAETILTPRDKEICLAIGPELKRRGLLFVGIDIIGGYLTEINVTSPTGVREIQRLSNIDVASLTIDAIEQQHPIYSGNGITR